jgi:hypothetical protein
VPGSRGGVFAGFYVGCCHDRVRFALFLVDSVLVDAHRYGQRNRGKCAEKLDSGFSFHESQGENDRNSDQPEKETMGRLAVIIEEVFDQEHRGEDRQYRSGQQRQQEFNIVPVQESLEAFFATRTAEQSQGIPERAE